MPGTRTQGIIMLLKRFVAIALLEVEQHHLMPITSIIVALGQSVKTRSLSKHRESLRAPMRL
jgi:hypothetical protein